MSIDYLKIIKGAPPCGKATHFMKKSEVYLKCSSVYDNLFHYEYKDGGWQRVERLEELPSSLSDIKEILSARGFLV